MSAVVWVGKSRARYHRLVSCAGPDPDPLPTYRAIQEGATPCRACRPEGPDQGDNADLDRARVDPANASRWIVTAGTLFSVVVATSATEARALGAYWFHRHGTLGWVDRMDRVHARRATAADVDKWLKVRRQQRDGPSARIT